MDGWMDEVNVEGWAGKIWFIIDEREKEQEGVEGWMEGLTLKYKNEPINLIFFNILRCIQKFSPCSHFSFPFFHKTAWSLDLRTFPECFFPTHGPVLFCFLQCTFLWYFPYHYENVPQRDVKTAPRECYVVVSIKRWQNMPNIAVSWRTLSWIWSAHWNVLTWFREVTAALLRDNGIELWKSFSHVKADDISQPGMLAFLRWLAC